MLMLRNCASNAIFVSYLSLGREAMLSRCSNCHGRKKLMGMGAMLRECTTCKGVGHIKLDVALAKPLEDAVLSKPLDVRIDKRSKEYRSSKKLVGE